MISPEKERLIFGATYIFLSLLVFPLYCLIITVFFRVRSFRKHTCYWIMSALGATNCFALIGLTGLGVRTVVASPFPQFVEKLLFAIHRFALTGSAQMTCILAFNRLCILTDWITVSDRFYIVSITGVGVYVCIFIGIFQTPYASIIYYPDLATNYFDEDVAYTSFFDNLDCTIGLIMMTSSFIMYIGITVFLVVKRFSIESGNSRNPVLRREVVIMIQGLADFCFEFTLLLNATTFVKFIPREYHLTGSYVVFVILGTGWMSPLMYLSMNSSLRREVGKILNCKFAKLTPSVMIPSVRNSPPISTSVW